MWILPKNSPLWSGLQATGEMNLGSDESSQLCAQSLSVRGNLSSLLTWSQKWKRDSWTRFLSGRMLRPSLLSRSKIESAFLSLPILASRSVTPASATDKTMIDTCGRHADGSFVVPTPVWYSLKTSKDTFRLDSPQSLQTWKTMVIQRRGEYSARLKSARLTSGKECLSWPTAETTVMEMFGVEDKIYWTGGLPRREVRSGQKASMGLGRLVQIPPFGLPAPVPASTDGSLRESWATPRSCTAQAAEISQAAVDKAEERFPNLETQLVTKGGATAGHKLNPRWVETLMGLPMGWTSPDAPASLIRNWQRFVNGWLRAQTERTNCECAATESCHRPQKEPLKLCIQSYITEVEI